MNESEYVVITSCKDCIFSIKDFGIQTGCKLSRLEKFLSKNEAKLDKDQKHYTINRFCNTCRNHDWLEENPGKDLTILNDTSINYGIIIPISQNIDYIDIQYSLLTNHLTYKPKHIYILHSISFSKEYINMIRSLSDVPITFTRIYTGDLVKTGISICDNEFFVVVNTGEKLDDSLIVAANNIINVDLDKVVIIKNNQHKLIHTLCYSVLDSDNFESTVTEIHPTMVRNI